MGKDEKIECSYLTLWNKNIHEEGLSAIIK